VFELKQGFDAEPVAACPKCENSSRRLIHSVPVVFKGSGFYVNDYGKGKSGSNGAESKSSSESESDSGSKSESKSDDKPKSAEKPKAKEKAEASTTTKAAGDD
jgi:predicted nucleic acid-binding Zn ribbon protein